MTTAPPISMLVATGAGPFAAPTGAISVGSISTITDDTKYNAWPVACRLPNGNLAVAYTKGDTHHGDNTGKAVLKISSDEGATWGSEITIYDDPSLWVSVYGISAVGSRVFATLWRDNWNVSGTGQTAVVYSDDNGATWTTWSTVATAFTGQSFAAGPVAQATNGDLLFTLEGSDSGDPVLNRSSHTLKSTNNGASWGSEVTVAAYGARAYYESKLVVPNPGSADLLCVHRTSAGTGTHYVSKSTDNGATWGAAYAITDGYGAPSTARIHHGMLLFATRRNSDAGVVAYTSVDGGATFGHATVVDNTMTDMEYACPIQLLDGRALLLYGSQPTISVSDSNIKAAYLTVS